LLLPGTGRWPVLLSIPHAGTDYPSWLLRDARAGKTSLEPLEDPLTDRLAWRAMALGVGAVIARTPRAAIDCNRGPTEMILADRPLAPDCDPGPRARGGLGLVPSRTPRHGELWQRQVSAAEVERRKAAAWEPYHQLIAAELAALQRRHGEVLLLDIHSMPARHPALPRLVIGDRHGRACAAWLGDTMRRAAEDGGFRSSFNDPYAGGYIVERHGQPATGVHALQLEFDRACYLGAGQRTPAAGFDPTARLLESLCRVLGTALVERSTVLEAAE
jgi:N-formylglutamate amidohydrolase